ncbi:MAG TPA: hypothetical protein VFR94_17015 [Nitrososphaeraceae archaeon]|jgi:hypothetical protein|nr:hypothetical protein [Nitrososphaeraceae archaeon]
MSSSPGAKPPKEEFIQMINALIDNHSIRDFLAHSMESLVV